MSNYRRLISYIYAYEGGIKGKNIGFAKIETRGIQCKITVSAKRIYVGGNDIGVYLLAGDQEIFLGNIFVRGGSGEFRTTVSANDVERSGINMDQCYGLTIHDVKSTWRCYTTIWEDAVAHAAEVDLENAVSASREKEQAEISEEQIKKAVQEIEEEFPLETDAPKTSVEESEAHSESIQTEQEPVESGETSDESLVHEETAGEDPVLREMASEEPASRSEISEEINQDPISEAATGERLLNSNPARGDLAGGSLPDENPESGEKIAEVLNEETLPDEEAVNEYPAGEHLLHSGESVNEKLASEESADGEPVIEARTSDGSAPPQAPFSPTTGPVPERRPLPHQFMSGWRQRNQPSAARTMPMGQPLPRPAAQGVPPTAQPLPHPAAPAPALFGRPSLNQQNTAPESRGSEANEASETQVKGTGSSPPVEMTFSEPCIPQNSQDIAGSTVCYQADAVIKEAPGPGGTQPSLGNPKELERLFQTGDPDEVPHGLIWQKLKHEHTRILAFDYEDGCEILTIKPQDIGILPRETWVFGNNSFLLHGYYNYRYLILAKLLNPQGDPRYILGIPGHFYSNERYMASMFGFPNFVLSKEQPAEDGRFGFWYTDIKLGG